MAFSYTQLGKTVFGDRRIEFGFYLNDNATTGGTINIDMTRLDNVQLTPIAGSVVDSHVVDDFSSIDDLNTSTVDITTEADGAGFYFIIGR